MKTILIAVLLLNSFAHPLHSPGQLDSVNSFDPLRSLDTHVPDEDFHSPYSHMIIEGADLNVFKEFGSRFADLFLNLRSAAKILMIQLGTNAVFMSGRYEDYFKDIRYTQRMMEIQALTEGIKSHAEEKYKKFTAADVFIVQFFYELDAGCTALLATDKDGNVVLAHNLDFPYAEMLRKTYVDMRFTDLNNNLLYMCSGIPGSVGVIMCHKPNEFSITLNEREENKTIEIQRRFMGNLKNKTIPTSWLIRQIMEEDSSTYEKAVEKIHTTKTISGSYIAIAGKKKSQGIIITRTPFDSINNRTLEHSILPYIVQCNKDWNYVGPRNERTKAANDMMEELRRNEGITLNGMRDRVLKRFPLLRNMEGNDTEGTISLVMMGPNSKAMQNLVYDPLHHIKHFIHTSELITSEDARCLKNNGYSEIIILASGSDGKIDTHAYDSAIQLEKVGINPNFYVTPCVRCGNAKDQAEKVCRLVKKTTYDTSTVYVDVTDGNLWGGTPHENMIFLDELVGTISACPINHKFSIVAGILTTKQSWESIMGTYPGYFFNRLWYVNLNGNPYPDDFTPFGGWTKPQRKTFKAGHTDCGHTELGLGAWVL